MQFPDRPIGVFDSGVGGLTVFHELARALPSRSLIYLGDCARVPYGTKSLETVSRYARQAAEYLLQYEIEMLVIACNTATAASLPQLQRELPIPVVGVIDPGADAVASIARKKVGIIATEGTVRSGAYRRAIQERRPDLEIIEAACPLFVPLAEEGWANTRVALEVAEVYLGPLIDEGIDTLVLGCTHYPILRRTIEQVIGEGIAIVDSAETTAFKVAMLAGAADASSSAVPKRLFLVTDAAERFRRIAGEFLEQSVDHLDLVDLDSVGTTV
jgi:glutamate racemase